MRINTADTDRLLLRPGEIAEALGISRGKAYEMIAAHAIPSIRIGGSVRVPLAQLRLWIERKSAEAGTPDAAA
jgi:excisionase family DNA binding protein